MEVPDILDRDQAKIWKRTYVRVLKETSNETMALTAAYGAVWRDDFGLAVKSRAVRHCTNGQCQPPRSINYRAARRFTALRRDDRTAVDVWRPYLERKERVTKTR